MRMFKVIGLAVVACAVLAVTALSVSAAEIKITTGQALPQLFLGSSSSIAKLRSFNSSTGALEKTVECPSILIDGLLRSTTDALVLLLFHKCTTLGPLGETLNCQTAGEPTGLIHTAVLALPVWLNSAKTLPGLLFEKDASNTSSLIAEFECAAGLVSRPVGVKGTVLGKILKPAAGVKSNTMEIAVETVGPNGENQRFTKVEEGSIVDLLEANEAGGAFKMATEEVPPTLLHFNTGVEAEFK